jgi:hypothetical protein
MGRTAKIRHRRRRRSHAGDWRAGVLVRYPNFAAAGYLPVRRKAGAIHWTHGEAYAITWRKP